MSDGSNSTNNLNGNGNGTTVCLNKSEYNHLEMISQAHMQKQPLHYKDINGKDAIYPIFQLTDYTDFDAMIQNVMIQYWTDEYSTSVI